MNDKEKRIHAVVDIVVGCCSFELFGQRSITKDDVLGKSRDSNANMTRSILVTELSFMGYSRATIGLLLH